MDKQNLYKSPVYPPEATRRGRGYGETHGYHLHTDGWVYPDDCAHSRENRVAQGWYRFYFNNRRNAESTWE